jgi:hypothetical protein
MEGWGLWALGLGAIYLVLLFTVCLMTFRKGHTVLGILGIFIPLLWLIGAVLPAKPGSRYDREQEARFSSRGR